MIKTNDLIKNLLFLFLILTGLLTSIQFYNQYVAYNKFMNKIELFDKNLKTIQQNQIDLNNQLATYNIENNKRDEIIINKANELEFYINNFLEFVTYDRTLKGVNND